MADCGIPENTAMLQPPVHWLIPYAACAAPSCQHALQTLALPHLDALLAHLAAPQRQTVPEDSPAVPHEYALAQALGLPERGGYMPWAAWQAQQQGFLTPENSQSAWAFVSPCYWQVGTDHIQLHHPDTLGLSAAESQTLLALLAPWFAEDGITLVYEQPTRWLAYGEALADLRLPSIERVHGSDVRDWLRHAAQTSNASANERHAAQRLQRLHSELQMLLYTHPFNQEREAQRQAPINALWVHGAGRWDAPPTSAHTLATPQVLDNLRGPALRGDGPAWAAAWMALDAGPLADLAAQARVGAPIALTLCGTHGALHWPHRPRTLREKITVLWRKPRFADFHPQL